MSNLLRQPFFLLIVTFCALWAAAHIGLTFRKRHHGVADEDTEDFTFIVGATLTLLGLIIGFTFSMAVSRYDQRMNFEEQEANAIGTEYLRVDALPPADAAKIRSLLKLYLDKRIQYYASRDKDAIADINTATMQIQNQLWAAAVAPAKVQPSPLTALAVAGMNDVLNAQGYAQAAWWNRIPAAAWLWRAFEERIAIPDFAGCAFRLTVLDCRHRQPAPRSDSHSRAKSGELSSIAECALTQWLRVLFCFCP
jgi:hypothetical protein